MNGEQVDGQSGKPEALRFSVIEIIVRAFRMYKRRPLLFCGIFAAIAGVPIILNTVCCAIFLQQGGFALVTLSMLLELVAYVVAQGVMAKAVQKEAAGEAPRIAECLSEIRGRMGVFLLAVGLVMCICFGPLIVVFLIVFVGAPVTENQALLAGLLISIYVAGVIWGWYSSAKSVFISIIAVIEGRGALNCLKRSWMLTGKSWLRVFGPYVTMVCVAALLASVPIFAIGAFAFSSRAGAAWSWVLPAEFLSLAIRLILDPIPMIFLALMYFTLEGIELQPDPGDRHNPPRRSAA